MHCVTQALRQMEVSGPHDHLALLGLDIHDPLQRMFCLGALLLVADELQNRLSVRLEELACQRQVARGELVTNAMTCRTDMLVGVGGPCFPVQAAMLEYHAADRTHGGLGRLIPLMVRIVYVVLDLAVQMESLAAARFVMRVHCLSPVDSSATLPDSLPPGSGTPLDPD